MTLNTHNEALLFVYGTLKSGHGNHARLLADPLLTRFLGGAISLDSDYHMDNIGFPIVWQADDGAKLKGEVYLVYADTLTRCDRLEGHPHMYRREERIFEVFQVIPANVEVLIANKLFYDKPFSVPLVKAWVYLWQGSRCEGAVVGPTNGVLEWKP